MNSTIVQYFGWLCYKNVKKLSFASEQIEFSQLRSVLFPTPQTVSDVLRRRSPFRSLLRSPINRMLRTTSVAPTTLDDGDLLVTSL